MVETAGLKLFSVTERISIKKFVSDHELTFRVGAAFYQLTKKETIQDYKTVVVRRKADGQLLAGEEVRKVLKLPKGSKKKVTVAEDTPDFEVFIQSSSHNRVLLPGTSILYQVGEAEVDGRPERKRKAAAETTVVSPAKVERKVEEVVEVVFSFDTTGSMYACLAEVRRGIKEAVRRLQREVPGIRIAIVAHGDYCDAQSSYVTRLQDFSQDEAALCRFVENVGATGGGDADECYELVLRQGGDLLVVHPDTVPLCHKDTSKGIQSPLLGVFLVFRCIFMA